MSIDSVVELVRFLKAANSNDGYRSYLVTEFKDLSKSAMAAHINLGRLYAGQVGSLVNDLRDSVTSLPRESMIGLYELMPMQEIQQDLNEANVLCEDLREHLEEAELHYKLIFGRETESRARDEAEATRAESVGAFKELSAGNGVCIGEVTPHRTISQVVNEVVDQSSDVKSEDGDSINLTRQLVAGLERTCARYARLVRGPRIFPEASSHSVTEHDIKTQANEFTPNLVNTLLTAVTSSSRQIERLTGSVAESHSQIDKLADSLALFVSHQVSQAVRGPSLYRNELNMGDGIGPKGLVLPSFSGENPEEFEGWWEMFEVVIGRNPNLSPQAKLLYLKSYMVKEAKDVIEALPISDEGYRVACKTLRNRFGFDAKCYDLSYRRLKELSLTKPPNNPKALMKLFSSQYAQYMRIITKGDFPTGYMELCLEPYPSDIQFRVRKERVKFTQKYDVQIDPEQFMNALRCAIQVQAEGWTGESHQVQFLHEQHPEKRSRNRFLRCRLCDGDHREYRCERYTTVEDRRKFIKDSKRCVICYRDQHGPDGCRGNGCWKCHKTDHGVAICRDWVDFRKARSFPERK